MLLRKVPSEVYEDISKCTRCVHEISSHVHEETSLHTDVTKNGVITGTRQKNVKNTVLTSRHLDKHTRSHVGIDRCHRALVHAKQLCSELLRGNAGEVCAHKNEGARDLAVDGLRIKLVAGDSSRSWPSTLI